jgi:hypothetical protein
LIPFEYREFVPEHVKQAVEKEIEKRLPDIKRLAKIFWEANWGEETHEHSPQVGLRISIGGVPRNDGSGFHYVLYLDLYSDMEDEITIYLETDEVIDHNNLKVLTFGQAETRKEDWF